MRVLTGYQQRIVYRYHWMGYKEEQIALIHNCSQPTINCILAAAEKKLQKYFTGTLFFRGSQTVVHMKEENGTPETLNPHVRF